jgi:CRP-like cAMP-binding protein
MYAHRACQCLPCCTRPWTHILRPCRCLQAALIEGEPAAGLCLVEHGNVRVCGSSPEGREQVLNILTPGAVFDGGVNPPSAEALLPGSSTCVLPRAEVARLLETSPDVAANVARMLAGRLGHIPVLVEELSLRQIVQRDARLLLEESVGSPATIQLTQDGCESRYRPRCGQLRPPEAQAARRHFQIRFASHGGPRPQA